MESYEYLLENHMNLHEAIVKALEQCKYMYEMIGDFTSEQYIEMVTPLHEAIRIAASARPAQDEESQSAIVECGGSHSESLGH